MNDADISEIRAVYLECPKVLRMKGTALSVGVCVHRPEDEDVVVPPSFSLPKWNEAPRRIHPMTVADAKTWVRETITHEKFGYLPSIYTCQFCCRNLEKSTECCYQCIVCRIISCTECFPAVQGGHEGDDGDMHQAWANVCLRNVWNLRFCDVCDRSILQGETAWTTSTDEDAEECKDVCGECKAAGRHEAFDFADRLVEHTWPGLVGLNEAFRIGRLIDWIPFATQDTETLLVNMDPHSPYKTAVMVTGEGVYASSRSLEESLQLVEAERFPHLSNLTRKVGPRVRILRP